MNFGQRRQFERVRKNYADVIVDLVGNQIDGSVKDQKGKNILSVAIESDNQEVFDLIMNSPENFRDGFFNEPDERGRFPIEIAYESRDLYFLERMLEAKADLANQQNTRTGTTLMHAVMRKESLGIDNDKDKEAAKIVRSSRPDMSLKNNRGETPSASVNRLYNIRNEQVEFSI